MNVGRSTADSKKETLSKVTSSFVSHSISPQIYIFTIAL